MSTSLPATLVSWPARLGGRACVALLASLLVVACGGKSELWLGDADANLQNPELRDSTDDTPPSETSTSETSTSETPPLQPGPITFEADAALDSIPAASLQSRCAYGDAVMLAAGEQAWALTTLGDRVFYTTEEGLFSLEPGDAAPIKLHDEAGFRHCGADSSELFCSAPLTRIFLDGRAPVAYDHQSACAALDDEWLYSLDLTSMQMLVADRSDGIFAPRNDELIPSLTWPNVGLCETNSSSLFFTARAYVSRSPISKVDLATGESSALSGTILSRGSFLDEDYFYWTNEGDQIVQRIAVSGESETETIAGEGLALYPYGVAAKNGFVYWAGHALSSIYRGVLLRTSLQDMQTERLARFDNLGVPILVGETCLFWSTRDGMYAASM